MFWTRISDIAMLAGPLFTKQLRSACQIGLTMGSVVTHREDIAFAQP